MRITVLALLALITLGCSHIEEGQIIAKRIEPEREWWYLMPIPHTICSGGKTQSCTTFFTYIPIHYYDDKDWVVTIQNGDDSRDVYVSEEQYACLFEGEWLDTKHRPDCRFDDPQQEIGRGTEQKNSE